MAPAARFLPHLRAANAVAREAAFPELEAELVAPHRDFWRR